MRRAEPANRIVDLDLSPLLREVQGTRSSNIQFGAPMPEVDSGARHEAFRLFGSTRQRRNGRATDDWRTRALVRTVNTNHCRRPHHELCECVRY
jgi:hypothetical protein